MIGINNRPIKTAGGLKIIPDCTVSEIDISADTVLLLAGADTWHDKKHKDTRTEYVTDIFMYTFNLILLDIIENNATFVLPLFGNKEACFHVKKFEGDLFKKMYRSGMFSGIDFLKSNFCGYVVNFQYTTTWGLGNKTLHLSPALKKIFYDNINNGKQYY